MSIVPIPRCQSLGDIIVDLSRLRGIAIDVPDNSIPREYVGLRDQLSPTDKGKGKATRQPRKPPSIPTSKMLTRLLPPLSLPRNVEGGGGGGR
jgi:hypothetical protein